MFSRLFGTFDSLVRSQLRNLLLRLITPLLNRPKQARQPGIAIMSARLGKGIDNRKYSMLPRLGQQLRKPLEYPPSGLAWYVYILIHLRFSRCVR